MAGVFTTIESTTTRSKSFISAVFVTEDAPGGGATCLAAAAIWRVPAEPRGWRWNDPFRRLRHYFGPLGRGLHLKGRFQPWSGSSGRHGEQETLYNPERRVIRVLGDEYALPGDARTLVLLIDERQTQRVIQRVLKLPPMPTLPDEQQDESAPDHGIAECSTWTALLKQEPEIRAFMETEV